MTATGIITEICPIQSGTSQKGNQWTKLEFVISTEEQHPRTIAFTLMNANIQKYPIQLNQRVCVDFDVDSTKFNEKWYHNIMAWRITNISQQIPQNP